MKVVRYIKHKLFKKKALKKLLPFLDTWSDSSSPTFIFSPAQKRNFSLSHLRECSWYLECKKACQPDEEGALKIWLSERVDLSQFGVQIELTTLTRMVLDAENFGGDLKYVKTFREVAKDGIIEYRDKTGTIHSHTLFFQEIPSCGDSGYTFDACKRLAKEYVQVVIDSLHVRFSNIRVFNATKNFSSIFIL